MENFNSSTNKRIIDLYPDLGYPQTLARVDNQYTSLLSAAPPDGEVEILDIKNTEARRTYERTLVFLLDYIAKRNGVTIKIEHSYGDTLYGRVLRGNLNLKKTRKEIKNLIAANKKIERLLLTKLEAMHFLQSRDDDIKIMENLSKSHIPVYKIDDFAAYFAGPLLPYTGFIDIFDLIEVEDGFMVILPSRKNPSELGKIEERKKLFEKYREAKEEAEILKIWDVPHLNNYIISGGISEIVSVSEAIHSEHITEISKKIVNSKEKIQVILISGPSSSGKTTFSKRLGVHLRLHGINSKYLYLDDYFVNREKTPRYKDGSRFFDAYSALNTDLFREHLKKLITGQEMETVTFDFRTGTRNKTGKKMRLEEGEILIVEGIHAFNPGLLRGIDVETYLVYVSALTQLNINRVNRIPTRDVRLLRRIFRDTRFRGYSAEHTLKKWDSVKAGEAKFIFPYQERADVMFNSSLVYELSILKSYLETPLRCVPSTSPYYCEALRLLNFLDHFLTLREDEIPPTSILREFIGGSSFYY